MSSSFQVPEGVAPPSKDIWDLPEKVLQFGSGRFLRAFVDAFIDAANRQGVFNGRAVVVQSTGAERAKLLNDQDGLWTLCISGLREGREVDDYTIVSSISRAVPANDSWDQVLACARNPDLELVVSNTTEVGIVLNPSDSRHDTPPGSFPAKLAAVLYERYRSFAGAPDKGLAVIPCELIEDNGSKLKEVVIELAGRWKLGSSVIDWIESANHFCNSLVDRIATGAPAPPELERFWGRWNYRDDLTTRTEPYSLWAIEGNESLKGILSLARANPQILVERDISPYRERKIRILNGCHTITAPTAFLLGKDTILQSMRDPFISSFAERAVRDEIMPSLDLDEVSTKVFIEEAWQRFNNPFLQHRLLDITFESTSKMCLRVVPSILNYYRKKNRMPLLLCLGFAFYLFFMKGVEKKSDKIYGLRASEPYWIHDRRAEYFYLRWKDLDSDDQRQVFNFVTAVCQDSSLWETNLDALEQFSNTVAKYLMKVQRQIRLREEDRGGGELQEWLKE